MLRNIQVEKAAATVAKAVANAELAQYAQDRCFNEQMEIRYELRSMGK